jgi:hypothetical protein
MEHGAWEPKERERKLNLTLAGSFFATAMICRTARLSAQHGLGYLLAWWFAESHPWTVGGVSKW